MTDTYRISAKVQPLKLPYLPPGADDTRLREVKLLVPMRGDQTIGELFLKTERVYSELFTKAPPLRISTLTTELGESLHTQYRISDVFEPRSNASHSSQWTMIVERKPPTEEELEEYERVLRPFSIGPMSYARPQGQYTSNMIELSAHTPVRQLSIRGPIQDIEMADVVIPSTEREAGPEAQLLDRRRRSPIETVVPNSQQNPDDTSSNLAIVQSQGEQSAPEVRTKRKYVRRAPLKNSRQRESNPELSDDAAAPAAKRQRTGAVPKVTKTKAGPANQAQADASLKQADKEHPDQPVLGSHRKNINTKKNPRFENEPELPPLRTESPLAGLDDRLGLSKSPAHLRSNAGYDNALANDDEQQVNGTIAPAVVIQSKTSGHAFSYTAGGIEADASTDESETESEAEPSRQTKPVAQSPSRGTREAARTPERRQTSEERDARTEKLRASLSQSQAELNRAGIQSTPRRTKLTPLIPGSNVKGPGSARSNSTREAADQGLSLLRTPSQSPIISRKTATGFAADRFKDIDRRAIQALEDKKQQKAAESDKAQLDSLLGDNPPAQENGDASDAKAVDQGESRARVSSDDVDEEDSTSSPIQGAAEPSKQITKTTAKSKTTKANQTDATIAADALSLPKKRGRPSKAELARRQAEAGAVDQQLNDTEEPIEARQPKEAPQTAANPAIEDETSRESSRRASDSSTGQVEATGKDGEQQPPPKKRGRPKGSKNRPKEEREQIAKEKAASKKTKTTASVTDSSKSPEVNQAGQGQPETPAPKRRGRPPGSKTKKPENETSVDEDTAKSKTIKTAPKRTLKQQNTDEGGHAASPVKAQPRKRKTNEEQVSMAATKKAKKDGIAPEEANAHAMDESEDRRAVVSAASPRAQDRVAQSPPADRQGSVVRSYSRSPAKEVSSSSEDEESTSSGSSSETSDPSDEQSAEHSATDEKNEEESMSESDLEPKVQKKAIQKSPVKSKLKPVVETINIDSADETQTALQPPKQSEPKSSADQANAQLEFEDTASLKTNVGSSQLTASQPVKAASSGKFPTFSGLRQQASQKAEPVKRNAHTVRTNPEFERLIKKPIQAPTTFSDESSDSSESEDGDFETQASNDNGSTVPSSKRRGFRGLLRFSSQAVKT